MLEHGTPADRLAALAALKSARGLKFVDVARATLPQAGPTLGAALREALSARGLPPLPPGARHFAGVSVTTAGSPAGAVVIVSVPLPTLDLQPPHATT